MKIENLYPGSMGSNCYVLSNDKNAIVIDPSAQCANIIKYLNENGLTLKYIILTHAHFDHIFSLDSLREALNVPAYIHKEDADSLLDGKKNAFYTFFQKDKSYRKADMLLSDGDILKLDDEELKIISTKGHTNGSICILTGNALFTGDTIFADSYGRCDLYSGDIKKMRDSIDMLSKMPRTLKIYPGHGPTSSLGCAIDRIKYL